VPPGLVHLDDVRVVELGDRLGLGEEPDEGVGPGVQPGEDDLEGDGPAGPELAGVVDDAHAAAAELADDLETRRIEVGPVGGAPEALERRVADDSRLEALERRVADDRRLEALEREVAALRAEVAALRSELGG
jgi:hypothetical protein